MTQSSPCKTPPGIGRRRAPIDEGKTWRLAACALALAALLGGCGGGGGGAATEVVSTPAASLPADPATTPGTSTDSATVAAPIVGTATETTALATAELTAAAQAADAAVAVQAEAAVAAVVEKAALTAGTSSSEMGTPAPDPTPSASTAEPAVQTSRATAPLIVRAKGSLAAGVGPQMEVLVDGQTIGTAAVSATNFTDYSFNAPLLAAGARVDVVFTNDAVINGADRNLYLASITQGSQVLLPTDGNSVYDKGAGSQAFDGLDTMAGQGSMAWGGALRLTWPAPAVADARLARKRDVVRFLLQASFGPTPAGIDALLDKPYSSWLAEQMALPYQASYVPFVQAQYDRGAAYRPKGSSYTPTWVGQKFWETAANSPDPLRKRVAFALHQIFMVSQADTNLYYHARAYAAYQDLLNQHTFGNYRTMLEALALSPAMGIYLSHMRNRKEDAATGRMPDENFAREIMQLFSIGLYELNNDGTVKLDSSGNPIETYTNNDVMALAKVFTGWSWAFADSELTDNKFRWASPDYSAAGDQRIDLLPMKAYPGQHSTAAKTLFSGKPWVTTIPANGSAQADLKQALDALFNHPNVGPYVGRQLIQNLVTSQPTPAYVARVAAVFNNNGSGVRGDLGAVVRAILLDTEARDAPPAGFGKLRAPVLRVAHWMRALAAQSASGHYMMAWELDTAGQRALQAGSVFGYFRPGYIPPNTSFATSKATAPEFQIINESTVAAWINTAEAMAGNGLGWTGNAADVAVDYAALGALADGSNQAAMVDRLNLLLLGGRMSAPLRQAILDTISGVSPGTAAAAYRARAATFLTLASAEYLTQP